MKRIPWLYPAIVLLGASGCSSYPNGKLPVAAINDHSQALLAVMRAADVDKDGVIQQAEWLALGFGVTNYLLNVAMRLSAPPPTN